jgi:hypothetical protein
MEDYYQGNAALALFEPERNGKRKLNGHNGNGHQVNNPLKVHNGEFEEAFVTLDREEQVGIAKDAIQRFFGDKKMKIGGRIPDRLLFKPKHVEMVLDLELTDAVDKVYAAMGDDPPEFVQDKKTILPSTERVIAALDQVAGRAIAKRFAPGIMYLYFKYCEGLPLG